jgi:glycosidase
MEPACGTVADVHALLTAAHQRNIHVLGRFAVDQTSRRHPWFAAFRAAPHGSSVRNCYRWSETPTCGDCATRDGGCSLGWDTGANAFYCHGATLDDPLLNMSSSKVQRALLSSIQAGWTWVLTVLF